MRNRIIFTIIYLVTVISGFSDITELDFIEVSEDTFKGVTTLDKAIQVYTNEINQRQILKVNLETVRVYLKNEEGSIPLSVESLKLVNSAGNLRQIVERILLLEGCYYWIDKTNSILYYGNFYPLRCLNYYLLSNGDPFSVKSAVEDASNYKEAHLKFSIESKVPGEGIGSIGYEFSKAFLGNTSYFSKIPSSKKLNLDSSDVVVLWVLTTHTNLRFYIITVNGKVHHTLTDINENSVSRLEHILEISIPYILKGK